MKNKKIIISITILVIAILALITMIVLNNRKNTEQKGEKVKIVTSFYPVYIITKNITKDIENIEVENMVEKSVGCIHDYTLMTSDLKKLEGASIFIQNGLGIENFVETINTTYPNIALIDSSKNIKIEDDEHIIETTDEHHHTEETNNEEHTHSGNAHIWVSFDKYIMQIQQIASELAMLDKANEIKYMENAQEYINKIMILKDRYLNETKNIQGKSILSLNESFEYLGENCNLNIITMETNHEESSFSAEKLKEIIEEVKNKNIKAIIIDRNDSQKNAEAIAKETGARIYVLDSALNGENREDSYINIMKNNLEILKNIYC